MWVLTDLYSGLNVGYFLFIENDLISGNLFIKINLSFLETINFNGSVLPNDMST